MFITKKALSRRTVLRGMGATLALPVLDAMAPAVTAVQRSAAQAVPRLGFFYVPNGIYPPAWRPTGEGTAFSLAPTMSPLEPFRDQLIPITGLSNWEAEPRGEGGGVHSRVGPAWWSYTRRALVRTRSCASPAPGWYGVHPLAQNSAPPDGSSYRGRLRETHVQARREPPA